jgi:hypothetical protein
MEAAQCYGHLVAGGENALYTEGAHPFPPFGSQLLSELAIKAEERPMHCSSIARTGCSEVKRLGYTKCECMDAPCSERASAARPNRAILAPGGSAKLMEIILSGVNSSISEARRQPLQLYRPRSLRKTAAKVAQHTWRQLFDGRPSLSRVPSQLLHRLLRCASRAADASRVRVVAKRWVARTSPAVMLIRRQCDEVKPVCQRCAKARRVCFGYQPAFSTVHNENTFASGQLKRPRGPRPKMQPASVTGIVLSRDVQTEAVAYYMRHHLEPVKDASALIDSPRESLLSTWNSSPVLDLALSSIALALFSRTRNCPPAAIQSFVSYRKSLQALQPMLRTLNTGNIDACLLTICLLSRYEDAVCASHLDSSTSFVETLKSRPHHIGAIAVLECWRNSPSLVQTPTKTIKYARRVIRKSALLRQIDLPEWLMDGSLFGEHDYEQALDKIIARIIRLRSGLASFSRNENALQPIIEDLLPIVEAALGEAREIDQALVEWFKRFPGREHRTRHELILSCSRPRSIFYHSPIYSYHNHAEAAICAQYYGYRLLAKQLEIQALEARDSRLMDVSSQGRQDCLRALKDLANELASTIPFCLERFATSDDPASAGGEIRVNASETRKPYVAELVVGPLILASATKYLDHEQHEWFRLQLADVGRLLGYGVLELAGKIDLSQL